MPNYVFCAPTLNFGDDVLEGQILIYRISNKIKNASDICELSIANRTRRHSLKLRPETLKTDHAPYWFTNRVDRKVLNLNKY